MRYRYNISFIDNIDTIWEMTLITTEEKTEDEIQVMLRHWSEVALKEDELACPVDVMDLIVENNPGWSWEDRDAETIYFVM